MSAVRVNKHGYFTFFLISLVLLILWTSRTDLPPKKEGIAGGDKKGGFDMGGLGSGKTASTDDTADDGPPAILQPPVPPPKPEWMNHEPAPPAHEHSAPEPPAPEPPAPEPPAPEAPAPEPPAPEAPAPEAPAPEAPAPEAPVSEAPAPEAPAPDWTLQHAASDTSSSLHQSASTSGAGFAAPAFDLHKLKKYKPHNYIGPGHHTYATYLSTRGGDVHDPYFLAVQQLVYRVLWDPRSKSINHPITVFVAPHIPEEQRDILTAAGALVRELDYVEGHVADSDATRWKDLFSKINMWGQTDYTRITFLDTDAFPVKNIDGIFEVAQKRPCQRELLAPEEQAYAQQFCEFVFTGTDVTGSKEVNAGVMVFEPNAAMHQYLLRESKKTENFDSSFAEQPFLNYVFRPNGPFPTEFIDRVWNGVRPQESEKDTLKVMHAKLWEVDPQAHGALSWAGDMFGQNWSDMLALYQSPDFESMRAADGIRAYRR